MAKKETLQDIAIAQRNKLLASNTYDNADPSDNYTAKHTRALSDNLTPVQGKGTGIFLDTNNGGGSIDIYGNPAYAGSGRLPQLSANEFDAENTYKAPDTSKNTGQVTL